MFFPGGVSDGRGLPGADEDSAGDLPPELRRHRLIGVRPGRAGGNPVPAPEAVPSFQLPGSCGQRWDRAQSSRDHQQDSEVCSGQCRYQIRKRYSYSKEIILEGQSIQEVS